MRRALGIASAPWRWWRSASIATRLFAQTTALLLVAALAAFALLAADARAAAEASAARTSRETAVTIAAAPQVRRTLAGAADRYPTDPRRAVAEASAALEPYAVEVAAVTDLDFVTIMAVDGTRYTHPDPSRIGAAYLGTIEPAQRGEIFTEVYTGTLGPSVRAIVPVRHGGRIVGLVAAGVTIDQVTDTVLARLGLLAGAVAAAIALAGIAAWLIARRLRALTHGQGPEGLARLFAAHEAALHSVDDGLVLIEGDRIALANDRARELLGVAPPAEPGWSALPPAARALAAADGAADRASAVVAGRSLLIDRSPAEVSGRQAVMLTIRDRTELSRISGELDSLRTMARALRAQTHEFDNRLHTIITLIELGKADQALAFAADRDLGQRVADRMLAADSEPVLAALLLGKSAQAHERGVRLFFETHLAPGDHQVPAPDLVTILGNLIDNAIDAAAEHVRDHSRGTDEPEAWAEVYLDRDEDGQLLIQVSDSGPGIEPGEESSIFESGWSSKAAAHDRGYGLALVAQTVERLGGSIEITRGVGAVFTVTLPGAGEQP